MYNWRQKSTYSACIFIHTNTLDLIHSGVFFMSIFVCVRERPQSTIDIALYQQSVGIILPDVYYVSVCGSYNADVWN